MNNRFVSSISNLYNNGSDEYQLDTIPISAERKRKRYVDIEGLTNIINEIVKSDLNKTIPKFTWSGPFHNILYIDLDYHVEVTDEDELDACKICEECTIDTISEIIRRTWPNAQFLGFIGDTHPDDPTKHGIHIFAILDEIASNSERTRIATDIKQSLYAPNAELREFIVDSEKDTYFDTVPLTSINRHILFPFACKVDSKRQYACVKNTFAESNDMFIIKFDHTVENDKQETSSSIPGIELKDMQYAELEEYLNGTNRTFKATQTLIIILNFFYQLEYLSVNHKFFAEGGRLSHENRNKFFYMCIGVCYISYCYDVFYRTCSKENWKDAVKILYNILKHLLIKSHLNDPETRCIEQFKETFVRTYGYVITDEVEQKFSTGLKKLEKSKGASFRDLLWGEYENDNGSSDEDDPEDDHEDNPDEDHEDNLEEDNEETPHASSTSLTTFGSMINCETTMKNFREFYLDILNNITDEYVSFEIGTEETFKSCKYRPRKNNIFTEYTHDRALLRSLANVIIPIELFELQNVENVYSLIIQKWIGHFMYIKSINVGKKEERTVYIFNQFQCERLYSYPYNQWIVDNCNLIQAVINSYYDTIKGILEGSNKQKHVEPLGRMYANCLNCSISLNSFKPLMNYGKFGYKSIEDGLCKSDIVTTRKFDEYDPAVSDIFPVRNGLLKWVIDGPDEVPGSMSFEHVNEEESEGSTGEADEDDFQDIIEQVRPRHNLYKHPKRNVKLQFISNPYEHYFPVSTVLEYDPDFEKNHPEACKAVWKYINEIYPVKEEREYMLKCVSTVLDGKIKKDTLIIQYGTGGDGKSFFSNAIMSMLGEESFSLTNNKDTAKIRGKIIKIAQIKSGSLGTSVKSSLLLQQQGRADGTDEGGRAQMAGKRFICMQEPDTSMRQGTLNGSTIKDLLSGSPISVRGIYKSAGTVQLNPLIFLQTNSSLKIDDSTDGAKRRIKYTVMRSKFYTETTKSMIENLEYKFEADPSFEQKITSGRIYRNALFHILIPYCKGLLEKGITATSKIPAPKSYLAETNRFFSDASGGFGAFANSFFKDEPDMWLPLDWVMKRCIHINTNGLSRINGNDIAVSEALRNTFCPNFLFTCERRYIGNDDPRINDKLLDIIGKYFAGHIYFVRKGLTQEEYEEYKELCAEECSTSRTITPSYVDFKELQRRFLEPNARAEIKAYIREIDNINNVVLQGKYWKMTESQPDEDGNTVLEANIPS